LEILPWKKLEPSWLPAQTQVGEWKVKAFHGGGAYGAVFRAVLAADEQAETVALKVAYSPWDPRFQREAELLSRVEHPSVPRLLGHGEWQAPGGGVYPYLVMQWGEGLGLYEWATRFNPGTAEVSQVLAQVARALEATHAAGGLHRDVKGDNIRVSATGRKAFLTDYGPGRTIEPSRPTARPGINTQCSSRARPNPSLERTRNGKAPWPCNAFVYDAPHGQGALPSRAAQLKR
jgi:serine/threonine protein kinase